MENLLKKVDPAETNLVDVDPEFHQEDERMVSKSPIPGDTVKLRKDALPHVRVREWTVLGKEDDRLILISYTPKGHALEVVNEKDIDWEEYLRGKNQL